MDPTLITGLFSKKALIFIPKKILSEVKSSLEVNDWYREKLLFLAGDIYAAEALESLGLKVHRIFDDAPAFVLTETTFRMKHWMVYQSLHEFGEVIWIDWDTISMKLLDAQFFHFCREHQTPKFVYTQTT